MKCGLEAGMYCHNSQVLSDPVLEWCLHHQYLQIPQAAGLCVNTLGPLWMCFCSSKALCHSICSLGQGFGLQQLPSFQRAIHSLQLLWCRELRLVDQRKRVRIPSTMNINCSIRATLHLSQYFAGNGEQKLENTGNSFADFVLYLANK